MCVNFASYIHADKDLTNISGVIRLYVVVQSHLNEEPSIRLFCTTLRLKEAFAFCQVFDTKLDVILECGKIVIRTALITIVICRVNVAFAAIK